MEFKRFGLFSLETTANDANLLICGKYWKANLSHKGKETAEPDYWWLLKDNDEMT